MRTHEPGRQNEISRRQGGTAARSPKVSPPTRAARPGVGAFAGGPLPHAAGNAAVVEAIRRGRARLATSTALGGAPEAVDVQTAPASAPAPEQTQAVYTFDPAMSANPVLFTDFGENYWVGDHGKEPEGYFPIEQHCAYMAVHWLVHGQSSSGLRFLDFPEEVRRDASTQVREWASAGGLAAQTAYAEKQLKGHSVTKEALVSDLTARALPPGTRVWFGSDTHAEAAVVTAKDRSLMYDPNTGKATPRSSKEFISYIASKNSFIVSLGPGAEPESCKCCVIM